MKHKAPAAGGDAPRAAAATAAIGLGGNVGDAASTLREALQAIDAIPGTRLLRASPLYRTPAWGNTDQSDFVNAAALVETTLSPRALLDALLDLERRFGRRREAGTQWGPRVLDLDLLLYGHDVVDEPGLRVPHPHLHERAFALLPLAQVAPEMGVPGRGTVRALLAAVDASGCERLPGA